ncbi:hypothetical protein BpJC7_24920 [Weizmannia acidilactici]|uniref:DUF4183 domain-containing protein n=1 Tax=Weizmannia acidilactici TaxID=2607726 RepID=A0A5J4JIU1_9BACI|nr:DUF4183 domain-containing protein [Weizmannia acidilactici]GER71189.1 hypothetical protein BpJC7_24920 [Weizmannia acidilactici]GER74832.1 hypothetical protein BpPP18_28990 [Weizmannia acidilactici]
MKVDSKIPPNSPVLFNFPKIKQQNNFIIPLKVSIFEYFTISDGCKRTYMEEDALTGYGSQRILDQESVSYTNLFINGVLQPSNSYQVSKGKLILLTDDIPLKGAPIILQMVKI